MRTSDYTSVARATSKALKKCWADPKWKAQTLATRAKLQEKTTATRDRLIFARSPHRFYISFKKWDSLSKGEKQRVWRHIQRAKRYGVSVKAYDNMTRGQRFVLALNYNKGTRK